MPHTFASLLVHVVFSTKDRAPDLSGELPGRLFPYLGGIVREYIAAQQAHHRWVSFQQEFLSLLRKHGLEFDAKDAWG